MLVQPIPQPAPNVPIVRVVSRIVYLYRVRFQVVKLDRGSLPSRMGRERTPADWTRRVDGSFPEVSESRWGVFACGSPYAARCGPTFSALIRTMLGRSCPIAFAPRRMEPPTRNDTEAMLRTIRPTWLACPPSSHRAQDRSSLDCFNATACRNVLEWSPLCHKFAVRVYF